MFDDNKLFFIVFDEFTISICSILDDVCEQLTLGGSLYGYAGDEEAAQQLVVECFHYLSAKNP